MKLEQKWYRSNDYRQSDVFIGLQLEKFYLVAGRIDFCWGGNKNVMKGVGGVGVRGGGGLLAGKSK